MLDQNATDYNIILRDYFAAAALPTVITKMVENIREPGAIDHCAGAAYRIADAMLKARGDHYA